MYIYTHVTLTQKDYGYYGDAWWQRFNYLKMGKHLSYCDWCPSKFGVKNKIYISNK